MKKAAKFPVKAAKFPVIVLSALFDALTFQTKTNVPPPVKSVWHGGDEFTIRPSADHKAVEVLVDHQPSELNRLNNRLLSLHRAHQSSKPNIDPKVIAVRPEAAGEHAARMSAWEEAHKDGVAEIKEIEKVLKKWPKRKLVLSAPIAPEFELGSEIGTDQQDEIDELRAKVQELEEKLAASEAPEAEKFESDPADEQPDDKQPKE